MVARSLLKTDLLQLFRKPPLDYSDHVTWFWETGKLSKERITWQLQELAQRGVGGTWFYVRYFYGEPYAAHPAYFTDEWWEYFEHSVAEHARLGLQCWTSDWTGAGNYWQDRMRLESQANPALKGHRLVIHELETDAAGPVRLEVPQDEQILTAAAYRMVGRSARSLPQANEGAQREYSLHAGGELDGASHLDLLAAVEGNCLSWQAPGPGWLVAIISTQPHDLNYIDPIVARRWIELYWKVHEQRLGKHVGTTLLLYGQDEMRVVEGNILYTPELRGRFQAERGYDPNPCLVGLFHDIGDFTDKIRCEYYDVMAELLEENFYKPLSDWHTEHNMQFGTIATWGREDMLGQVWHYVDFFRLMRWFHVTGNEDPVRGPVGQRCFIDAKFSSSVLHLYQRDRAGMCVYWGSGWGMTQEENVSWTNENFAYGLNLYNTHGGLYSTFGGWYHWVPPQVYWRQPYWENWKAFIDYVSRMSAVMSQGVHCADVALLYPLTTVHAHWLRGNQFTATADDTAMETFTLAKNIFWHGLDFDFVDDNSLAAATIEDGKLKMAGIEFRAVVLPPMTTVRTATLEKLKAFYEAGGVVLAFRRLPSASVECGRNDPHIRSLVQDIFGIPSTEEYTHDTDQHSQATDSVHRQTSAGGGISFYVPTQETHASFSRKRHRSISRRGPSVPELISGAITQDVLVSGTEILHTHQKIGDQDAYFLFNLRPEQRDLSFTFRLEGEPEIWDAATGKTLPVHRFVTGEGKTTVRLTLERYAGVILVFTPAAGRPQVAGDDLTAIVDVVPEGEGLRISALSSAGGYRSVQAVYDGQSYSAETVVESPLPPVALDGDWDFQLRPTMNNQWGDFRDPPSPEYIGAEARRFRYMPEDGRSGVDLGWHSTAFDAGYWPLSTQSFGPYWYSAGPFAAGQPPADLLADALAGKADTGRWQHFDFSQQFGYEQIPDPSVWGGRVGVLDEFIYFPASAATRDAARLLLTHVCAPTAGEWDLRWGTLAGAGQVEAAWVNGVQVLPATATGGLSGTTRVSLKAGVNDVVVQLRHIGDEEIRGYVVFLPPGANVDPDLPEPRLKWFAQPSGLLYDITPEKRVRAGWYRFLAPSGTQALRLSVDAEGVEAWVDGEPVAVRDGEIRLDGPCQKISQVALRVAQKPGVYAGAVFQEPVRFECGPGKIALGDWCQYALEGYSGGGIYHKTFRLAPAQLQGAVILDLGMANTSLDVVVNGKPVATGLARPFRYDISAYVLPGDNELQVTVYNTLANYFAVGPLPSDYVFEGQTLSGLIGPVRLEFPARLALLARPLARA